MWVTNTIPVTIPIPNQSITLPLPISSEFPNRYANDDSETCTSIPKINHQMRISFLFQTSQSFPYSLCIRLYLQVRPFVPILTFIIDHQKHLLPIASIPEHPDSFIEQHDLDWFSNFSLDLSSSRVTSLWLPNCSLPHCSKTSTYRFVFSCSSLGLKIIIPNQHRMANLDLVSQSIIQKPTDDSKHILSNWIEDQNKTQEQSRLRQTELIWRPKRK